MTSFSSLRARLVGTVFLAVAPAWAIMYAVARRTDTEFSWTSFIIGLVALLAAWLGGERFVLRQVRLLYNAVRRFSAGHWSSRTGLSREKGELGDLARAFDKMASSLEQRVKEREHAEKTLLNRSFQQTVVGALGQFAMVSKDLSALFYQSVMLVAQTLEVEYAGVLELSPNHESFVLINGVGWRAGVVGKGTIPADASSQAGFTLTAGEPVVVDHLPSERRFHGSTLLLEHGVVSGITVAISGQGHAFGVLGAHTTNRKKFTEDEVHFLLSIATLLAMAVERNRAESEMEKLAAFAQLNPNPAMELGMDGSITYFNDAALKLALSAGQDSPRAILPPGINRIIQSCLLTGQSRLRYESQVFGRTFSWAFHPVAPSKVVHCYVEDITEKLNLEAQLRQSQKMESVGQLAAGVAHDFNNMLSVIQGHAGMLIARPGLPTQAVDSSQAIFFAAERAASLTRQLLMFSRKNVMQPTILDLREVVTNLSKMLKRMLGETITLRFDPPSTLPLVRGDVGMLEQVLMNLAVNARDAMPKGGTVTVSAKAVLIDQSYAKVHPEARPGEFLSLAVRDTGCGMSAATMSRIFEPFFTTKEVGKGTGLGLATVYGIVKQHEGWLEVASEPGKGATFTIYLPAQSQPVEARQRNTTPAPNVRGGKETILVVEDESVLRDMAHVILEDCGYRVILAGSGVEALRVWHQHPGKIDLVLTDVVMPEGMSGVDLAHRLLPANPRLKIIFASGYSMDELDTDFIRQGNSLFLQKPYTHITLAKAVRDCLDRATN